MPTHDISTGFCIQIYAYMLEGAAALLITISSMSCLMQTAPTILSGTRAMLMQSC